MSATYVVSGGTEAFVGALASRLRAPRLLRLPDDSSSHAVDLGEGTQRELGDLGASLTCWIHILPDASCAEGGSLADASASLLAAAEQADTYLPPDEGAEFTIVVPVGGTAAPRPDARLEAAASYVTGSVLDVEGGWNAYSWFYPARDL